MENSYFKLEKHLRTSLFGDLDVQKNFLSNTETLLSANEFLFIYFPFTAT